MSTTAAPHIPTCAQLEKYPCFNRVTLEGTGEHLWSGWPGAYCLVCHSEDKDEVCLALSCVCPCHDEMWAGLKELERKERYDQ